MSREVPLGNAIRVAGQIFTGSDHADATRRAYDAFRQAGDEAGMNALEDTDYEYGFVTSEGRFVGREEAEELARENGGYEADTPHPSGFTSVDLRRFLLRGVKSFSRAPGAHAIYR